MHQLKVTSHVFLYDSVATAITRISRPFRESREQKRTGTYHHSQVCKPFRVLLWSPRLSAEYPRKSLQQTRNGQISSWPANPKGVGVGVDIPALIWARKGSMAALGPLMANQPMQSITLKPTRNAVIHRLAPAPASVPVLPRVHKAAVHRLAWTREQQRTRRDARLTDGGLHRVCVEPGRAPDVGLDELASVFR